MSISPGTECPLPDHPELRKYAQAFEASKLFAIVFDDQWRLTYMTTELRTSWGDRAGGNLATLAIGRHLFSSEAADAARQHRFGLNFGVQGIDGPAKLDGRRQAGDRPGVVNFHKTGRSCDRHRKGAPRRARHFGMRNLNDGPRTDACDQRTALASRSLKHRYGNVILGGCDDRNTRSRYSDKARMLPVRGKTFPATVSR